jgi:hypothetical protein
MAEKRKVDVFAGEGSVAGLLKKRRQAVEDDKLEDFEQEKREYTNSSSKVVHRGYRVENEE